MQNPCAPKIPLVPNTHYTLRTDDISRALVCATAVYEKDATHFFAQSQRGIQFEKVHMSLDLTDPPQRFMVAYSRDAIFIAFRGTETFADVSCDLEIDGLARFQGRFHRGFFKRSKVFYVGQSPQLLMFELLRSDPQRRVILCGHSMGGAVSHMVLLRFLLENNMYNVLPTAYHTEYPDSLISIAFGAPHVCDGETAKIINDNDNFNWRFVNFVNQTDPVPRLLHQLRSTAAEALGALGRTFFKEVDMTLKKVGGLLGDCNDDYPDDGIVGGLRELSTRLFVPNAGSTIAKLTKSWHSLLERVKYRAKYDERDPYFSPIGRYVFLEQLDRPFVCWLDGSREEMAELLKSVQLDSEDLAHHPIRSYNAALVKAGLIEGTSLGNLQLNPSTNVVVTTPEPEVTYARFRALDTGGHYIIIKGKNLLFLRERVILSGVACETLMQRENELWVSNPSHREASQATAYKTMHELIIRTTFGQTCHFISEDFLEEPSTTVALNLFPKIVQTRVLMAQPPLRSLPSIDDNNCLDNLIRCAFEPKTKLSTHLQKLAQATNSSTDSKSKHIADANHLVNRVMEFMKSSLLIEYKADLVEQGKIIGANAELAVEWISLLAALCGVPMVKTVVDIAKISIGVVILALRICVGLSPYRLLVESYDDILDLATKEASLWEKKDNTMQPMSMMKELDLQTMSKEEKLEMQVERSDNKFKQMIQEAHSSDAAKKLYQLKSQEFQGATFESMMRFLRRIKIVVETRPTYRKEVAGKCMVGILGAEDAGKSTFVKKALQKAVQLNHRPPHATVPETGLGHGCHTTTVKPYKFEESLWLVDFPGGNGTEDYADQWHYFTALPSFAILLLDFKDDIKQEQVMMYKGLKDNLKTKILVAFNKVDERYTPRNEALYSKEYFCEQKVKTARKLQCEEDDIYYLCLDPDLDPIERFHQLKRAGVLDFEEFLKVVLAHATIVL
ncbi:unnamed protein product [Sphagnum jensenii]|uniref:Fungal lipase-type domain-containing protein n=1 Tax=Sphagnum jensenii TaxID=128206 RepID=A0ABP1AM28_9BRYO